MTPTLVIDNTSKPRRHKSNVRPVRMDPERVKMLEHLAHVRRNWTIETAIIWLSWFMLGFVTCAVWLVLK